MNSLLLHPAYKNTDYLCAKVNKQKMIIFWERSIRLSKKLIMDKKSLLIFFRLMTIFKVLSSASFRISTSIIL